LYNFKVDDKTHKNDASIAVRLTKNGQTISNLVKSGEDMHQTGNQITIQDVVALNSLAPGQYHLEIDATDQISKQTITRASDFTVTPPAAPVAAQMAAPGR
jgi:predicted phage tail protein